MGVAAAPVVARDIEPDSIRYGVDELTSRPLLTVDDFHCLAIVCPVGVFVQPLDGSGNVHNCGSNTHGLILDSEVGNVSIGKRWLADFAPVDPIKEQRGGGV